MLKAVFYKQISDFWLPDQKSDSTFYYLELELDKFMFEVFDFVQLWRTLQNMGVTVYIIHDWFLSSLCQKYDLWPGELFIFG